MGSNNLSLLFPAGQYGTRGGGGKDQASARYIFTHVTPSSWILFNPADDALLTPQKEDNLVIEPEWYLPILPMLLVNGAEGIGTGRDTFPSIIKNLVESFCRVEYYDSMLQPCRYCGEPPAVNER